MRYETLDFKLRLETLRKHLTPRQRYILDRLLAGETYAEIGQRLWLGASRVAAKKAVYREVRKIKQQARQLGLRSER